MSFTDSKTQVLVIAPAWSKSNTSDEAECQTDPVGTGEHAVQTRRVRDIEVFTEGSDSDMTVGRFSIDEMIPTNEKALIKFLKRAEPILTKSLLANANSRAFLTLEDNFEVTSENKSITCEFQLCQKTLEQLSVTSVTWNSTGSVLAAALSYTQHDAWCAHRGQIVTWNIRRSKVQNDKADLNLETESCTVCLAYHPHEPSWLAAGSFSGQLTIYDTSNTDDPVYLKSASNKAGVMSTQSLASKKGVLLTHVDAITQVRWTSSADVMTASVDGRVILWKVRKPKRLLEATRAFLLTVENLPRSLRPKSSADEAFALRRRQIAITDVSVSSMDSELCVLASDCGCVFRSDLQASIELPTVDVGDAQLNTLQCIAFKSCQSPITHVQCSPFLRNLIAASASNGMLLFYDTSNTSWLRAFDSGEGVLNAIEFSPSRPCVLVGVGNRGHLLVYDLLTNQHSPVCRVDVTEGTDASAQPQTAGADKASAAVLCTSFNAKDPALLATGDSSGKICVWKLANDLVVAKPNEVQTLASNVFNFAE